MLRFLLQVAFAAFFCVPAFAGGLLPDRASVLVASHHVNASQRFEELNPGLFLTWEDRAFGLDYSLGAYRNSYGRGSVAAFAALPVVRWREGEISLSLGAAYYPGNGRTFRLHAGDVVPMAGLQLRHRAFLVQVLPSDGRHTAAVVAAGLTFPLQRGRYE